MSASRVAGIVVVSYGTQPQNAILKNQLWTLLHGGGSLCLLAQKEVFDSQEQKLPITTATNTFFEV
jgi:hypothetical protein